MEDLLGRVSVRDTYKNEEEWFHAVEISRKNLINVPSLISTKLFTNLENLSDNDVVIVSKIGISLLSDTKLDLYEADNWEILSDNWNLLNNNTQLKNIRELYFDQELYKKGVAQSKTILSKSPPQNFIDKWPIIGDENFRKRMSLSDNNSLIATRIALLLGKGQMVSDVYQTDDWELLSHNLLIVSSKNL